MGVPPVAASETVETAPRLYPRQTRAGELRRLLRLLLGVRGASLETTKRVVVLGRTPRPEASARRQFRYKWDSNFPLLTDATVCSAA